MSSIEPDAVGLIVQRVCEYLQPVLNAILAGVMALLHGAYRNVGIRRRLLNAAMCALLALDGARCAGADGHGIKVGEFSQRADWLYGGGLHQRLN